MPEIHEQEGKVIEYVDRSDLVIEFDAVEELRLTVQEADIAQMQIAMAAPDLACASRRSSSSE